MNAVRSNLYHNAGELQEMRCGVGVSSNPVVSLYAVQPKQEGRLFQKAMETGFLSLTVG